MSALTLTKHMKAPAARIYDAFLDNELTRAAYDAAGMGPAIVERDLTPGGKWRIAARQGEMELVASGEYVALERPTHIAHTFAMLQFSPNDGRIDIEITPNGEGCDVTYTHSGTDIAAELAALAPGQTSGTEMGWRMMLNGIAAAVEQ